MRRWAVSSYLFGLPISAFLAWKIYTAGFEPLLTASLVYFGHTPARLAVTIGHQHVSTGMVEDARTWLGQNSLGKITMIAADDLELVRHPGQAFGVANDVVG